MQKVLRRDNALVGARRRHDEHVAYTRPRVHRDRLTRTNRQPLILKRRNLNRPVNAIRAESGGEPAAPWVCPRMSGKQWLFPWPSHPQSHPHPGWIATPKPPLRGWLCRYQLTWPSHLGEIFSDPSAEFGNTIYTRCHSGGNPLASSRVGERNGAKRGSIRGSSQQRPHRNQGLGDRALENLRNVDRSLGTLKNGRSEPRGLEHAPAYNAAFAPLNLTVEPPYDDASTHRERNFHHPLTICSRAPNGTLDDWRVIRDRIHLDLVVPRAKRSK